MNIHRFVTLMFVSLGLISTDKVSAQSDRLNSIVVESNFIISSNLSYDRFIYLNDGLAVTLGGDYWMGTGFGWGAHFLGPEANLVWGSRRSRLETGVLYVFALGEENCLEDWDENHSAGLRLYYRWQGTQGLTFRVGSSVVFGIDPIAFPGIGLGCTF